MLNRKIAAAAFVAIVSAPSAFAADVIYSDGRQGGAFWGQPITASPARATPPRSPFMIGQLDPSDGQPGGAYWGSPKVAPHPSAYAAGERFVATAQRTVARPFAFLEDYNN